MNDGRRSEIYWETDFGQWISDTGVQTIVDALATDPQLAVTNFAVYAWLRGHAPTPPRAIALVELSHGRLTLDSIYRHGEQMRKEQRKCEST